MPPDRKASATSGCNRLTAARRDPYFHLVRSADDTNLRLLEQSYFGNQDCFHPRSKQRGLMRKLILSIAVMVLAGCFICGERFASPIASLPPKDTGPPTAGLPPKTLCGPDQSVIFPCPLKRPAPIA